MAGIIGRIGERNRTALQRTGDTAVLLRAIGTARDEPRYQPLLRKAMLRRIGLRGVDPALFKRPKSGFVLPFDRWIRRGLNTAIDQTLRNPQAVSAAGLDAGAVRRLWEAFHAGNRDLYWSRIWAAYVLVR
jgi:asparagine synthase (glutamine-hydrolysing)